MKKQLHCADWTQSFRQQNRTSTTPICHHGKRALINWNPIGSVCASWLGTGWVSLICYLRCITCLLILLHLNLFHLGYSLKRSWAFVNLPCAVFFIQTKFLFRVSITVTWPVTSQGVSNAALSFPLDKTSSDDLSLEKFGDRFFTGSINHPCICWVVSWLLCRNFYAAPKAFQRLKCHFLLCSIK